MSNTKITNLSGTIYGGSGFVSSLTALNLADYIAGENVTFPSINWR